MHKNIKESKKLNLGIELLRTLLCFWIVLFHCSNYKKQHTKYIWRLFHVPTFFVISFYFYYPILFKKMINKNISRFQRLLIPYILWPVLIFIANKVKIKNIFLGQLDKKISLKELAIQILLGKGFHGVFWFQFNLIFISLLFSIISFSLKNNILPILHFLSLICLYLHFSGKSYFFFMYTRYKSSLGTLIELMPLSVIGCIYCSLNLIVKANYLPLYFRIILFILIHFLFEYDIFILPLGFRYPNVILYILASTILILSFGSLNFDYRILYSLIYNITKYTGGIYYIHTVVRDYLLKYIFFFKKRTYFSSLVIYFFSYGICFTGCNLFKKQKLKYLFI